jgi:CHAD domain
MLLGSVPDIDVLIDRIESSRLHADSSRDGGIPDRDSSRASTSTPGGARGWSRLTTIRRARRRLDRHRRRASAGGPGRRRASSETAFPKARTEDVAAGGARWRDWMKTSPMGTSTRSASVRSARYAAELSTGALHEEAGPLAKQLADLQDVLGEVQDAVVAEERLTSLVRPVGSPGRHRSRPGSSRASRTRPARTHATVGRPHGKRRGPSASGPGSADCRPMLLVSPSTDGSRSPGAVWSRTSRRGAIASRAGSHPTAHLRAGLLAHACQRGWLGMCVSNGLGMILMSGREEFRLHLDDPHEGPIRSASGTTPSRRALPRG